MSEAEHVWLSPSNDSTVSFSVTSLADTLSTTNDTDSTSRTIPGPGALSGKAILALGKATLRGAEIFIIRRRFQVISSKFPHKDEDNIKGIERMYEDVLELSRHDLYSDAIRTRALHIILVQIGSQHVEKLVQCLTTWPDIELLIFLSELIELFNPLRLFKAIPKGKLSDSVQVYQTSLASECHGFEPLVTFLCRLVLAGDQAAKTIFQAGVMEFLLHTYILGFPDPFATTETHMFDKCSQLRAACDSLLDAYSKTKKGSRCPAKARLHVLWPPQPKSQFSRHTSNRPTRRAEIWRSMEPESITLRMHSISNMMLLEDYRDLRKQDSLDDIASDILEFSRHGLYHEATTNWVLEMCLILIGSRRIKELVYCISTWPSADIQTLVSKLTNMFNPLRLSGARVKGAFSSSIQTYQSSLDAEGGHSLEPIIGFLDRLAQASDRALEAVLGGDVLEFFVHLYITNFFDPLGVNMFHGRLAIRVVCDSLLRTCLSTRTGQEIISEHALHTLWPTALPGLPFIGVPMIQSVRCAEFWKTMEPGFIVLRMQSIFNMMVMEDRRELLELDSLEYISLDMLEFFRDYAHQKILWARIIDMILLLVDSSRTEELVYCFTAWPPAEIRMLISKLMETFNPLQLINGKRTRLSLGSSQTLQDSISTDRNNSLKSVVIFFDLLAQASDPACQVILAAGGLDFLFHLYLANFSDPLATDMFRGRLTLRVACDSLLRTFLKTEQGSKLIGEHQIRILWPTTPTLQFTNTVLDRQAKRAEVWRSLEPASILLRLTSMLNMVQGQQKYRLDLPEFYPLSDVVTDALEFFGQGLNQYPHAIKTCALSIILVLVGSGTIEELVPALVTCPPAQIEQFIAELAEVFVSELAGILVFRAFGIFWEKEKGSELASSLLQTYYLGAVTDPENHSLEPIVTFFNEITRERPVLLQDGIVRFLLQIHLSDFYDPLSATEPAEMRSHSTLQKLSDLLSTTCFKSRTNLGLKMKGGPPGMLRVLWTLWTLQPSRPLGLELQSRLAGRAEIWKLMDDDLIVFRLHVISNMTPATWKEPIDEQESLIRTFAVADLMGILRTLRVEPSIKDRALRCLHNLLFCRASSEIYWQAICQELVLQNIKLFSVLLPHIFQHFSDQWQGTTDTSTPLNELSSGSKMVLDIVDFFVDAAKINDEFRTVLLEAGVLGLLRPFLELELWNTTSPLVRHDGKRSMVYDERDLEVLTLIRKHGLLELLPNNTEDSVVLRRGVLSRILGSILKDSFWIHIEYEGRFIRCYHQGWKYTSPKLTSDTFFF